MKNRLEVTFKEGCIVIDGVKYKKVKTKYSKIDQQDHFKSYVYKRADKEYDKKRKFVAKRLSKVLDVRKIGKELAEDMNLTKLDKVYEILQNKEVKIKEHPGCYGLYFETPKKKGKRNFQYIQVVS